MNSAVQQILQKCPEAANTQKSDGYTALHLAACMDHSDIAKTLLDKVTIQFYNFFLFCTIHLENVLMCKYPEVDTCLFINKPLQILRIISAEKN